MANKNGKYAGVREAAKRLGISPSTLSSRVYRGMSLDDAIVAVDGRRKHRSGDLVGLTSVAKRAGVSRQRVHQVINTFGVDLAGALALLQENAAFAAAGKTRPQRCTKCLRHGHRAKTCGVVRVPKERQPRRCARCRGVGHNSRTCSTRAA